MALRTVLVGLLLYGSAYLKDRSPEAHAWSVVPRILQQPGDEMQHDIYRLVLV